MNFCACRGLWLFMPAGMTWLTLLLLFLPVLLACSVHTTPAALSHDLPLEPVAHSSSRTSSSSSSSSGGGGGRTSSGSSSSSIRSSEGSIAEDIRSSNARRSKAGRKGLSRPLPIDRASDNSGGQSRIETAPGRINLLEQRLLPWQKGKEASFTAASLFEFLLARRRLRREEEAARVLREDGRQQEGFRRAGREEGNPAATAAAETAAAATAAAAQAGGGGVRMQWTSEDKEEDEEEEETSAGVSATLSRKGLEYAKDVVVEEVLKEVLPLAIPDIQLQLNTSIGRTSVNLSRIVLWNATVPGAMLLLEDGDITVFAGDMVANLTFAWSYSYGYLGDHGNASVGVSGMQVGAVGNLSEWEGALSVGLMEYGCVIHTLNISLSGGTFSWLYNWLVALLPNHLRAAVQRAIGDAVVQVVDQLNTFLHGLPRRVEVDDTAALDVSVPTNPSVLADRIVFESHGVFVPAGGSRGGREGERRGVRMHRHPTVEVARRRALLGSLEWVPLEGSSESRDVGRAHDVAHDTAHDGAHGAAHDMAHDTAHDRAHGAAHDMAHDGAQDGTCDGEGGDGDCGCDGHGDGGDGCIGDVTPDTPCKLKAMETLRMAMEMSDASAAVAAASVWTRKRLGRSSEAMEGEVKGHQDRRAEEGGRMVLMSVREEVLTSAVDVYYGAGVLSVYYDKMPDDFPLPLNTRSWRFLLPRLYHLYPDKPMVLTYAATSAPAVAVVEQEGIAANVASELSLAVILDDEVSPSLSPSASTIDLQTEVETEKMESRGSNQRLEKVLVVAIELNCTVVASLSANNVTGEAFLEQVTAAMEWSRVGNIPNAMLEGIVRLVARLVIVPEVNSRLAVGYPLPSIPGVELRNANVAHHDGRLDIGADLLYTGGVFGGIL